MTAGPEGVVRFYNGRGTAEQWIKEGKYALNWARLSCHRFVANQVRLSLQRLWTKSFNIPVVWTSVHVQKVRPKRSPAVTFLHARPEVSEGGRTLVLIKRCNLALECFRG